MDIGLNDELNGLAEYDYDSPNHQNETWARSMARSALESQREMTGDCIIPTDVFAVIAEILAGSRDLETLAHLNIASRQIHAGTLPVLYETLVFSDEKALSNAFQRPPLGWKYTKNIFVTEITLPLLRLHLQYHSQQTGKPTNDLSTVFPRLTVLGLTDVTSSSLPNPYERPLYVTLYKPIDFTSFLRACLPFGLDGSRQGISFFGTHYFQQTAATSRRSPPHQLVNIVRLEVRPGAGIVREKKSLVGMAGWHARWCGTDFALDVSGEANDIGVESTLRTVMDHLALYGTSKKIVGRMNRKQTHLDLDIRCTASVWERFVELYDSLQPFFLCIRATLTTPVTMPIMQQYLTTIASTYHQHWREYDEEDTSIFLQLDARTTEIDADWIREFQLANDPEAHLNHQEWHGTAQFGCEGLGDDEALEHGGPDFDANLEPGARFEVALSRALMYKDEHQHGEQSWCRTYRAAPRPPAPIDQVTEEISEDELPEEEQRARHRARVAAARERSAQARLERQLNPLLPPPHVIETLRARLRENPVAMQHLLEQHPEGYQRLFGPNAPVPVAPAVSVAEERVRVVQFADDVEVQENEGVQEESDTMEE